MPSNPRNRTQFRNQSELHLITELNHSSASSLESWVLGPACVLFAFGSVTICVSGRVLSHSPIWSL